MDVGSLIVGILGGVALATAWRVLRAPVAAETAAATDNAASTSAQADSAPSTSLQDAPPSTPAVATPSPRERLAVLRRSIEDQDEKIQHPDEMAALPEFKEGVALLTDPAVSSDDVVREVSAPGWAMASMAAAALAQRPEHDIAATLAAQSHLGGYPLKFLLDDIQARGQYEAVPEVLRLARSWWLDASQVRERVHIFLDWATKQQPATRVPQWDGLTDDTLEDIHRSVEGFRSEATATFLKLLGEERARRKEQNVLGGFGQVYAPTAVAPAIEYPAFTAQLQRLHDLVTADDGGAVLVVGESGVGKTVLVDAFLARLHGEGWLLFEASAADVLAGQQYIGQLEGRMRELSQVLNRPKALWRVIDMLDLLFKGGHEQDPRGILDLALLLIERGHLRMVGELTPRQLAQLQLARPAVRRLFDAVNVQPPDDADLATVLEGWAERRAKEAGTPVTSPATLAEARQIGAQFFPEQQEPGRSLRLLDDALELARQHEPAQLPLTNAQLVAAVATRSGMPLDVIDDGQGLDLEALRSFFRERVIGQDEAVETLVDRIAMLKAGLVDGTRPIGVFLFAGPTGTGKTELAKALGELVFGSSERLLRLDMSEYQSEDSGWRLLEDDARGNSRSLVARIREQPFSVVLLDEFEKAHPRVWDLFLQVFDDGRLSDRSGHVADFRHSIIILTSNVGSTLARSAGPGFTATAGGYSRGAVEKALAETFRREFINRLDKVVLFNPLDRAMMRDILHKELRRVMTRRGLRKRGWMVEWEPSAIEFLLDRGFTPDLGARPLRRAIEQHVLAPLAHSIVEHRAPEGDQFLFVRAAGQQLDAVFVDPEADNDVACTSRATEAGGIDLRSFVHAPVSTDPALLQLKATLSRLQEWRESDTWQRDRQADFDDMAAADFWNDSRRHAVLDRIERRDRIESALDNAARMAERLQPGVPAHFSGRFAQTLWLLELAMEAVQAQQPQDALLDLSISESERRRQPAEARLWWKQLLAMYLAWAEHRNMRVDVHINDPERCHALLSVSGFAALSLLEGEHGLHVQESEDTDDGVAHRLLAAVQVSPDLPGRSRRPAATSGVPDLRVTRRYRERPSPLVRDSVRGWRSGRLDRVLGGEFDTMSGH